MNLRFLLRSTQLNNENNKRNNVLDMAKFVVENAESKQNNNPHPHLSYLIN